MLWQAPLRLFALAWLSLSRFTRAAPTSNAALRSAQSTSLDMLCQAPKKKHQDLLQGCPFNTTFVSQRHSMAKHVTINSALNSLPDDGSTQTILIDSGHYYEKVLIHRSSPTILLGVTSSPLNPSHNKVVVWQSSYINQSDPTSILRNCDTVTLGVGTGSPFPLIDFKAYNIDFVQRQFLNGQEVTQYQLGPSAALCVERARASFYACTFSSYQDTLYVGPGSEAFFFKSVVKGMTDQLYGSGKAWFEKVELLSRACGGGITAWRNPTNNPTVGVYISNSHIARSNDAIEKEKTLARCHLGRPWDKYAHAVFLQTTMEDIIAKDGFRVWSSKASNFDPTTTRFQEFGSSGPGGNLTGRDRRLEQILTKDEADKITIGSVFGDTPWIDWKRVQTWN